MKRREVLVTVCFLLMAALVIGVNPLFAQGTMGDGGQSQGDATARTQAMSLATPDYFGATPNYANSPLPDVVAADTSTFYFAEGTLRPNFAPYLCIQNTGTAHAEVTITYYKGDGTQATATLSIPQNSRSTVLPEATLGTGDDPAHDFSAEVKCTNGQPIIAERPMYFNYNGQWTGGHDVVGAIATAKTFYFAEGYTGPGFDEWVCVLNQDNATANLTFDFQTQEEGLKTITGQSVPPHSRATFKVNDLLGSNFQTSLKLSSDVPVVAERPMYFNYNGEWTGGHDVVGATAPAEKFYFAEGTCRPGFDPYICIQNPGGTDANVTITYMLGDGTSADEVLTVPANHRSTILPRTRLGTANDSAHDFSALVECTNREQIVVERPMYFNYNGEWAGGHDVVGITAPQTTFNFAEGTCRPGFDAYLCIQNPGLYDANVTITYMRGAGAPATQKLVVPKGTRTTVLPKDILGTGEDAEHDFSARVECTNLQKIVAERPMYFNYNGEWTGGHDVVGFSFDANTSVVPGTGIRKFVSALPGLGAANANDLGQYIPVAVPDKTSYPGADYYEIELGEYTEQLHQDLPPTTLRGYRQTNSTDPTVTKFSYLGPLIVAQKDRPVRVKFTNKLPIGAGGDLFLPVDTTVMGAGMGPNGTSEEYTQNRASVHLHGGNTPWISDGTMHQWITPAGETTSYPQGVSVQSVPDMPVPVPGDGTETFYYTNQQSARLMFYHDHAYGITRLTVYSGQAAGYIVQDSAEAGLINSKVIPADQVPLVIQDKTFVPDAAQLAAEDPTWDTTRYGGKGNLWYPHVYMPNQNPGSMAGANDVGRWDYGPWFWPPFTGLVNGPIANPYYDPVNAPWEPATIPGTPNPSIVPEAFMDTPLVNGAVYPYLQVAPKAYRFRILNASNDRSLNLQIYFAKSDGTMWNPTTGALANADAGEVNMVPAVPDAGLPASWPTDGRDGGVPDPSAIGPDIIQIGNEGGFIPGVAELPNTPIGYNYNRRDITVLNVSSKTLFLGPAERADVIVDFSKVPDGAKLILYNDAPAPVPAFDPRYDYYTGDPDQTGSGGAPSTVPGYGPNTRTIMQFQVSSSAKGGMTGFNLNTLKAKLPAAYAQFQPKPIVPQADYNAAFNANYPVDAYSRIEDTSMSFFNGPLTGIKVTNGGTGYTTPPGVNISGGGGTSAAATAQISGVTSTTITNPGSGYTIPPDIAFTGGGGGSGAAATAQISGVTLVGISNGGTGYTTLPDVTFTGGGGSGATGVATIANGAVTGVTITNGGSGYTSNPAVAFANGNGAGAAANATISLGLVTGIVLTNGGTGYTSNPLIGFSGGGSGINAAANAAISPGVVTGIILTNGGTNYTSAPTVTITGGGGSSATATAVGVVIGMQPKAIQELFDPVYGRMNAQLGVEVPNTNISTQTTIPYYDVDPPTEIIKSSDAATPIGTLADGTQIWKITHNGVDTHAIHWHMFNVQLINRVGWDGMVKPPDANELGWKETVRMNPLEDAIVALRPIIPVLPWDLPNSIRALDPANPIGSNTEFTGVDPSGQPVSVTNHLINFGWEYVWHCHLLGHEENIMMRPMAVGVAPAAPSGLGAVGSAATATLTWTDNSRNETNWTIQRATSAGGPWTTVATVDSTTGPATGGTINYIDTPVAPPGTYYYQVIANNVLGDITTYPLPAIGYPNMSVDSVPSGATSVVVP